jgi:DNA-binding transcriptional LysR family regulator
MVPGLPAFLEKNPALRIELIESVQYVDLVTSGVDLAVRIAAELDPRTITRRIGRSRVIIVATPGYLAAHGRPHQPADIRRHRCAGFSPRFWGHEWHFIMSGETVKIPVTPLLLTDSSESMRAAAVAGLGLVALPQWMVADLLASGVVARVLDEYETPESGIYAVYPTARLIPAKVKRFVEHTAQVLKSKGF